jgi:predicted nucleic acid-binding protein
MRAGIDPGTRVVIDSNFVVKLLTKQPESRFGTLWREWESNNTTINAPALMPYEVTNAFWKFEISGTLSSGAVERLIERMNDLQIELVSAGDIHLLALELVRRYWESKAYDSHFLALAQFLNCDLWTSDKKLYNKVSRHLPWVQYVDD